MHDSNNKKLKNSLEDLGDLAPIIKNIRTGNQVTGHQRLRLIGEHGNAQIVYTWRATETPQHYTVALGYIIHPLTGERFAYREVDMPTELEMVANIASNHRNLQGEFDDEALAKIDYDLSQLSNADELLALTGQDDKELQELMASIGVEPDGEEQPDELGPDSHDDDNRRISATHEQWSTIDEAVEYVKARVPIPSEDKGTKYGSSLYYICRVFLEGIHSAAEQAESQNTPPTPPGELTDIPQ